MRINLGPLGGMAKSVPVILGVFGSLGLILTYWLGIRPVDLVKDAKDHLYKTSIVLTLVVLFAWGVIALYLYLRELQRSRKRKAASKSLYFVATRCFEIQETIREIERTQRQANNYDALLYKANDRLLSLLSDICHFFDDYTGYNCHVSVKVFKREDGKKTELVKTYARDELHKQFQRWNTDKVLPEFRYTEHTPFKKIIEDSGARNFISNNLSTERDYHNRNGDWKRYYNAVLIVPISSEYDANKISLPTVEGFFCVDNMKGGFDTGPCVYFALLFAKLLHNVIVELRRVSPT